MNRTGRNSSRKARKHGRVSVAMAYGHFNGIRSGCVRLDVAASLRRDPGPPASSGTGTSG